jgi:tyrosine-protein kinase Etk/Wzc
MDSIFSADFQSNARLQYRYADSDYRARKTELESIDAAQAQFESAHGAVALKEQTTAAIEQVARLQALHDSSEIAANLLRMDFSEQNPGTQTAEMMAREAEQAAHSYITEARIGPSLTDLPALSKEYAEILRSKKSLEPIVSYLRQEVEQQRINQERERTLVVQLDSAKVPDHKSAPKRVPMILLGATVGLALSIFYAAIRSLLSSWKIERIRRGAISVSEA